MQKASVRTVWMTSLWALCVSLILGMVLLPSLGLVHYQQYDFWLLWLCTMFFVALPFVILEVALAKRTQHTPLHAFMQLTREADSSTRWRLIAWGGVVFIPFLVGALVWFASSHVLTALTTVVSIPMSSLVILVATIVVFGVSLLPRIALWLALLISTAIMIGLSLWQLPQMTMAWQWTGLSLIEWSKALSLTLVTGGLGLGLYWQHALFYAQTKSRAMPTVLPIFLGQFLGLAVLSVFSVAQSFVHILVLSIAIFALSGLLLQFVREQLIERQIALPIQAVVLLVPILLWAIPLANTVFYQVVIIVGLLLAFVYAVFVGWLMKISHVRKAINFSNELIYNLWRVAIRIIIPLSIILACIGWVMAWISGT